MVVTHSVLPRIPTVGIAIAARNEVDAISPLLDSIASQTTDSTITVAIADGSPDGQTSAAAAAWSLNNRNVKVLRLSNPEHTAPAGFNMAVRALATDVVIILGAHSKIAPDFVERNLIALRDTGADCTGGLLETRGRSAVGHAIAAAMSSPFGVGNARFRVGGGAGPVDTAAFGAYRSNVFEDLGGFDAGLVGAEDDEFNLRLIRSGGTIWFDPAIQSTYFCRDRLADLWKQYWGYGRGKSLVLLKHKRPPSARMFAPAALVLAIAISAMTSIAQRRPHALIVVTGGYLGTIGIAGLRIARRSSVDPASTIGALATLHLSYGTGLIHGVAVGVRRHRPSH